jgi:UDP-N-acetylglucosamine enolpyruvyl transferase
VVGATENLMMAASSLKHPVIENAAKGRRSTISPKLNTMGAMNGAGTDVFRSMVSRYMV